MATTQRGVRIPMYRGTLVVRIPMTRDPAQLYRPPNGRNGHLTDLSLSPEFEPVRGHRAEGHFTGLA